MRILLIGILAFLSCAVLVAQSPDDDFYKAEDFLFTDQDSAYFYYERAIQGFRASNSIDDELIGLRSLLYANGYYYDLKSFKRNLTTFEQIIKSTRGEKSAYLEYFQDRLLLEKINYYFKISNYQLANTYIDTFERVYTDRAKDARDVEYYENSLSVSLYKGSIYSNQGKIDLALDTYNELERFIARHQDSLEDPERSYFSVNRLLAKTHASLGNYNRAITTQLQLIEHGAYRNSRLDLELDLSQNLMNVGRYKEAGSILSTLENANITKPLFRLRLLKKLATLALLQSKEDAHNRYFKQRIEELIAYRNGEAHPDVIAAYIQQGADERHWGNIDAAFAALHKAAAELPPLSELQNFQLTRLHLDLAAQYIIVYQTLEHPEYYAEEIVKHSKTLLKALDILQPQFESRLDKQYLIDTTYPALQNAFVLMSKLFKSTQNQSYLEQAFAISEKSKAIELRSTRQAGIAQSSLQVDPDLIEKENLLTYTINRLEKQQFTRREVDKSLQDSLLGQKENYGDFIDTIRNTYPEYYNLRYRNDIATLTQCKNDQLLHGATVSFFQVGELLYALKIDKNTATLTEIYFPLSVQQKVREYHAAIATINRKESLHHKRLAQELYKLLITPIFSNNLPESLTIVPDGLLHYLPFEALQEGDNYLVERTAISYKPSVSFQQGVQKDVPIETSFVGFAPRFSKTNSQLAALSYNELEVEQANRYFKGKVYLGVEGSLGRFRESIKINRSKEQYPIYHFATHAITNDTLPEYSYLAFTPEVKQEDHILYAKDLYTEKLNAAMVVLSACETGLGKLENGQGMQSLAQGFYYGGASSLLYSKWSVSDRQTATIMTLFYKYLDEGLSKDKALQQSKIEYLTTVDDPNLKHPFFWASFVFSGDAVPLKDSSAVPAWIFWISGVLLLMVILCSIFIKKVINSSNI